MMDECCPYCGSQEGSRSSLLLLECSECGRVVGERRCLAMDLLTEMVVDHALCVTSSDLEGLGGRQGREVKQEGTCDSELREGAGEMGEGEEKGGGCKDEERGLSEVSDRRAEAEKAAAGRGEGVGDGFRGMLEGDVTEEQLLNAYSILSLETLPLFTTACYTMGGQLAEMERLFGDALYGAMGAGEEAGGTSIGVGGGGNEREDGRGDLSRGKRQAADVDPAAAAAAAAAAGEHTPAAGGQGVKGGGDEPKREGEREGKGGRREGEEEIQQEEPAVPSVAADVDADVAARSSLGTVKPMKEETLAGLNASEGRSLPSQPPVQSIGSVVATTTEYLRAYFQILEVATALQVSERDIVDHAVRMFRDFAAATLVSGMRSRNVEAVATAALVQALREAQLPRTLQEVSIAAGVAQKELGKSMKQLMETLRLRQPANCTSISMHMPRFCSLLQLDEHMRDLATHIGEEVISRNFCTRRNPISVSAAAIYLACQLEDKKRTQAEICKATGLTEVTLRKVHKELVENVTELLPRDYSPTVTIERILQTMAATATRGSRTRGVGSTAGSQGEEWGEGRSERGSESKSESVPLLGHSLLRTPQGAIQVEESKNTPPNLQHLPSPPALTASSASPQKLRDDGGLRLLLPLDASVAAVAHASRTSRASHASHAPHAPHVPHASPSSRPPLAIRPKPHHAESAGGPPNRLVLPHFIPMSPAASAVPTAAAGAPTDAAGPATGSGRRGQLALADGASNSHATSTGGRAAEAALRGGADLLQQQQEQQQQQQQGADSTAACAQERATGKQSTVSREHFSSSDDDGCLRRSLSSSLWPLSVISGSKDAKADSREEDSSRLETAASITASKFPAIYAHPSGTPFPPPPFLFSPSPSNLLAQRSAQEGQLTASLPSPSPSSATLQPERLNESSTTPGSSLMGWKSLPTPKGGAATAGVAWPSMLSSSTASSIARATSYFSSTTSSSSSSSLPATTALGVAGCASATTSLSVGAGHHHHHHQQQQQHSFAASGSNNVGSNKRADLPGSLHALSQLHSMAPGNFPKSAALSAFEYSASGEGQREQSFEKEGDH